MHFVVGPRVASSWARSSTSMMNIPPPSCSLIEGIGSVSLILESFIRLSWLTDVGDRDEMNKIGLFFVFDGTETVKLGISVVTS
jgi:hypothetical protein